jgi:archaellum component FlaC
VSFVVFALFCFSFCFAHSCFCAVSHRLHEATLVDSKRFLVESNKAYARENAQLLSDLESVRVTNMELSLALTQRECAAQEAVRDLNNNMRVIITDRDSTLLALSESEQEQVAATEKLEQLQQLMSESSWQSLNAQLELEHAHIHEAELAAEVEHVHQTFDAKCEELAALGEQHRRLKDEFSAVLDSFEQLKANFGDGLGGLLPEEATSVPAATASNVADASGRSTGDNDDARDSAVDGAPMKQTYSDSACSHDMMLLKSLIHKLLVHYCPHSPEAGQDSQGVTIRNLTESIKVKQQAEPLVARLGSAIATFQNQLDRQKQLLVDAGSTNEELLEQKDAVIVDLTEDVMALKQQLATTEASSSSALAAKDATIKDLTSALSVQKQSVVDIETAHTAALAARNKTVVTVTDELRQLRQARLDSDAEHRQLVDAKDQTIADLKAELVVQKRQFADAEAAASSAIVSKDVIIVSLRDALDEHKDMLSDSRSSHLEALAAKDRAILSLTEDLQIQRQAFLEAETVGAATAKDNSAAIADLTEKLRVQIETLAAAEAAHAAALALKNSTIIDLTQELQAQKQLNASSDHSELLHAKDTTIGALQEQLRVFADSHADLEASSEEALATKDAVIAGLNTQIANLKHLSESEIVVTNAATAYWENTSIEQGAEIQRLNDQIFELNERYERAERDQRAVSDQGQHRDACSDVDTVRDSDAHLQQKLTEALRDADDLSRKLANADKAWAMVQQLTKADEAKSETIKSLKQELADVGKEKQRATRHYEKAVKQRDALKAELAQIDADLLGALQKTSPGRRRHDASDDSPFGVSPTGRGLLHNMVDTPPAQDIRPGGHSASPRRSASGGRNVRDSPPHRLRGAYGIPRDLGAASASERPLRSSSRNRGQRVNPNA